MKVILKSAFFKDGKVFKKGDKLELETAAFKPYLMAEVPEVKVKKVEASEKPTKKTKKSKE